MRPYEVMIIFGADLEEETIRSAVARYSELIVSKGAEPGPIDFWGKRRFAYELKHRWEGYYVVLQTKSEPAAMEELHRVLSLADDILRHKILRIPEQVYGKLAGRTPERQSRPAPEPAPAPEPVGSVPEPEPEVVPEPVGAVPEAEAASDATDA